MTDHIFRLTVLFSLAILGACSDSDGSGQPFRELYDQGADRYLGVYSPSESSQDGDETSYTFGMGDGPRCLDGSAYTMSVRDTGGKALLIFLEGGGACWSTFCAANETASAGVPRNGIMNPELEGNPLAAANVAYFPYCDGSLFTGDVDNEFDIRAGTEYQRGLKNLSAGLDVVANSFAAPSRIVLAGNSGGGFGTIFALPLVRKLYPNTPIDIINDSGMGFGIGGDPGFQAMLIDEWNSADLFPESACPECIANGHLTEYFRWQFAEDPNFRLAMLTSKQDLVIGTFFLGVGGPAFESYVASELPVIESYGSGRMRSWVVDGTSHTYIQRDVAAMADGVTVLSWLTDYLRRSSDWVSVSD